MLWDDVNDDDDEQMNACREVDQNARYRLRTVYHSYSYFHLYLYLLIFFKKNINSLVSRKL
jgi:hypothetical protein